MLETYRFHRRRKIGKIRGGPARPSTRDNNMKYTIVNIIGGSRGPGPWKLQGFHKNLIKLWYFRDHLPGQVWFIGGGGKPYSGPPTKILEGSRPPGPPPSYAYEWFAHQSEFFREPLLNPVPPLKDCTTPSIALDSNFCPPHYLHCPSAVNSDHSLGNICLRFVGMWNNACRKKYLWGAIGTL